VGNSGVIYQDVDASLLEYHFENRLHALLPGHVAAIGFRVPATGYNLACNRFGSILVDVQQADAGSATGKPLSDCPADAAGPSRNHGKFAVEAKNL